MSSTTLGDLSALFTALIWSIGVVHFKKSSEQMDVTPLKVFQNWATFAMFVVGVLILGEPFVLHLDFSQWTRLILSSFLGIVLGDTLYILGLKKLGAGGQALADCFYTPSILVFAFIINGDTPTVYEFIGAGLIISAIILGAHVHFKPQASRKDIFIGLLYGLAAQTAIAICILSITDLLKSQSVMTLTMYRYFFGSVLFMGTALLSRQKNLLGGFKVKTHWKHSILAAFWALFLSTYFWFLSFKLTSSARAAIYTQLSSVFIFILARLVLKEEIDWKRALAIVIATLGGIVAHGFS